MHKILLSLKNIFSFLMPTICNWLLIIALLILLLILFKCFSAPYNVSFKRVRKIRRIAMKASKRKKCFLSTLEKSRMRKHMLCAARLVDATLYEEPSMVEIKKAKDIIERMILLLDNFEKAAEKDSERNKSLIVRSITKNADAFLALPKLKKYGCRA